MGSYIITRASLISKEVSIMHGLISNVRRVPVATAVSLVLLLMMTSVVSADPDGSPDGGPSGGRSGGSQEATEARTALDCRADVLHRIITEDAPTSTNNSGFLTFVGTNVFVPANTSRCILVEVNAENACYGDGGTFDDFCYLRALANGVEMLPISGGLFAFQSEDPTAESNSARWVRRVVGGPNGTTYTVALQHRVDGGATRFYLDDWLFSVSVLS